jgi:sorting nexin-25
MVSVLYPVINMLTDPDSINQKILTYIQQQPQSETLRKKTYAYAASFEDFIKMIKDCNDTEVLKHIRYVHSCFWLDNGIMDL